MKLFSGLPKNVNVVDVKICSHIFVQKLFKADIYWIRNNQKYNWNYERAIIEKYQRCKTIATRQHAKLNNDEEINFSEGKRLFDFNQLKISTQPHLTQREATNFPASRSNNPIHKKRFLHASKNSYYRTVGLRRARATKKA